MSLTKVPDAMLENPAGGGTITGATNVGSGTGTVFKQVSGANLQFKNLTAGAGISLTNGTNDVTIATTGPGTGTITGGTNLGAGSSVFKDTVGANLRFRTIIGGTGITATENANDITLTSAGEANTASNVGSGSQVFKAKTGVDLAFRSLTAGSNITLVQNANDIQITSSAGSGGAAAFGVLDCSNPPSIVSAMGIASISRNGNGDYTVTWTSAFSSVNYTVVMTAQRTGATTVFAVPHLPANKTTTTFRFQVIAISGGTHDNDLVDLVAFE